MTANPAQLTTSEEEHHRNFGRYHQVATHLRWATECYQEIAVLQATANSFQQPPIQGSPADQAAELLQRISRHSQEIQWGAAISVDPPSFIWRIHSCLQHAAKSHSSQPLTLPEPQHSDRARQVQDAIAQALEIWPETGFSRVVSYT